MKGFAANPRLRLIWVFLLPISISIYVGAYYSISRTSAKMVSSVGGEGFYYVPDTGAILMTNTKLQRLHYTGVFVFYPAWLIDYYLFGGKPVAHIPDIGVISEPVKANGIE